MITDGCLLLSTLRNSCMLVMSLASCFAKLEKMREVLSRMGIIFFISGFRSEIIHMSLSISKKEQKKRAHYEPSRSFVLLRSSGS